MEDNKVSIIIPTYNVEKYVFRAIESSINQTYSNIEVVIVDDGSSDQTVDIIRQYEEKYKLIKTFYGPNKGVSVARNIGMELAAGDYFIFLDSDDWLDLNCVEVLMELVKENNNKNKMICCDRSFAYFDSKGNIYSQKQNMDELDICIDKEESLRCIVNHRYNLQSSCYKIFSKKVIMDNSILFNSNYYHGEDGLFVFEYLMKSSGLVYVNKHLWNILERPGSATTGSFNEKWLTAIDSAREMMRYPNLSTLVGDYMNLYFVDRVLMVMQKAILFRANKKMIKVVKRESKKMMSFYLKADVTFRQKLIYCTMTFLPSEFVRYLLILNSKGKK